MRRRWWLLVGVLVLLGVGWWWQIRPQPATPQAIKLLVREDGMYEVSLAQLNAQGVRWSASTALRLRTGDAAQPLWATADGAALRFYGAASTNPFDAARTYWLEPGAALAPAPPPPTSPADPADHAATTLHVETNRLYTPLAPPGEHWLWANLTAPATLTIPLTTPAALDLPALLQVHVWSSTAAAGGPDHHLQLWLNDTLVGEQRWDGMITQLITATVPAGVVHPERNELTLRAPGDTGSPVDTVLVDWVELHYERALRADGAEIKFIGSGAAVRLQGLARPSTVIDISDPLRPAPVIIDSAAATVALPTAAAHRYLAAGAAGWRTPAAILPALPQPDLRTQPGADYLIIGAPDLLPAVAPLVAERRRQGLHVATISSAAVFDQWGAGSADPAALRSFLQYLAHHADPVPRYVLLLGDATYDPRGYLGPPPPNALPSPLIQTTLGGETASDTALTQLSDTTWLPLAIGRFPARTAAEVSVLVAKTLAYERAAAGPWQRTVLAVADPQEPAFAAAAQSFVAQFPPATSALLSATPAEIHRDLLAAWADGRFVVAYFGHGSITQWGKDQLLQASEAPALATPHLPIVINMTCLTGLFTHPRVTSLAEQLLAQPNGGSVAVLAPTSLTLATDQQFLSDQLARGLQTPGGRLGDMLIGAHQALPPDQLGAAEIVQTFLLFGDPALQLPR